MQGLRRFLRKWPRLGAALAFGISTSTLIHFAWYPEARWRGMAPVLTLSAGLAHAIGGAITGRRLLDATRTRTVLQAALLGAATSFLALLLFTPPMAVYLFAQGRGPDSALGYLILTAYTGIFAFLGAGWALLLLSAAVGLGLQRLAGPPAQGQEDS